MRFVILQTCIPDYRIAVFREVIRIAPDTEVWAGGEFFAADITTRVHAERWHRRVSNVYLINRIFLWQRGVGMLTQPDVLICEYNPRILSNWWLLLRRFIRGKKTYLWGHIYGHGKKGSLRSKLRLLMCRMANGMICYSESQANQLRIELPNKLIWSAPNSCVMSADCTVGNNIPVFDVIYVGRLTESKKPKLLVKAFALILRYLPSQARLIIVGDGAMRVELESLAKQNKIGDRIEFLGHVSNIQQLSHLYQNALFSVSPGYVGLSAIQSMAFGVPMLVAEDEHHSPEIEACVEDVTARFFKADCPNDLAEKMLRFYNEQTLWLSRRAKISAFIASKYSIENMAKRLISPDLGITTNK